MTESVSIDKDVEAPGVHAARSAARLAAVQALYQMELAGRGADAVIAEFQEHRLGGGAGDGALIEADAAFFADLVAGVVRRQDYIDRQILLNLADGWTLARIDSTARAILRAGFFEIIERLDVPYKAIIDEYVEIAKAFFEGPEIGFVNALMDKMAGALREDAAKGRAS